jgi:NADPH:quinone reductase-like Zn-dependent oxidoreductase
VKAVVYQRYGSPDVLELRDIPTPTPKANQILVKVRATTVNRTDCAMRKAEPIVWRAYLGLTRPRNPILGSEFAGDIEAVGPEVTTVTVGDQIFGLSGFGANAEYLCVREGGSVAPKPPAMTYEEAASVCDGATAALTCLRKAQLRVGQRILVYGASGSVGTAAVQLAKYFGAEVTAVSGTRNLELAKSLGADKVIDYTQDDFTKHGQIYDAVLDAVGKSTYLRCRELLKPEGIYVSTGGPLYQNLFFVLWTSRVGRKKAVAAITRSTKQDIHFLKELIEEGKYRAVIDRGYLLEQITEAHSYVETERKTGNVVITVAHSP